MSNTAPNFTKNGIVGSAYSIAANTSSSGTGVIGTDMFLVALGGANGTWIERVKILVQATTPTSTTLTVGRLYISTQAAGATTADNTYLIHEQVLPVVAADSATIAQNIYEIACNFRLPAGYTILFSTHAAPVANTNWRATAIGGDY